MNAQADSIPGISTGSGDAPPESNEETTTGHAEDAPRHMQVRRRQTWLLLAYEKSLQIALILVLLLAVSLAANIWMLFNPVEPQYFASTQDGRIIEIYPSNQPYLRDSEAASWAAEAVKSALNLDFVHWRNQLTDAKAYFTPDGYENFIAALDEAGLIKSMVKRQLVFNVQLDAAPVILDSRVDVDNIYKWEIQIPILITAENSDADFSVRSIVTIRLIRVSTVVNNKGVQVQQFIMGPVSR